MSTQELIAAALTAAEVFELSARFEDEKNAVEALREACARATVQPDVSEVERLVQNIESCAKWAAVEAEDKDDCRIWREEQQYARTALLGYVRGILAERDALIADNERLMQVAVQEVSAAPQPVGAAEVPMPEENILKIRALDSAEVRWIDREALRTYGEQCRAAGYAAGEKDAIK